ncbi:MAG: hydroxymethylglutaryl-CoA synthase [Myxococcales bacterium]|nr:hydroxymethylglutaryl-CoA synthase [Myxococcales bacterium]
MSRTRQPIGIDALAYALPRAYLDLRDLAEARGVPASKYLSGLGTAQMAVAGPEEDPVALAANAARRVLLASGRSPDEIGLCIVGTETAVDHSKPVAAYLHGLLGLPSACRVFESKHACFGGTAGLLNALDWIAAGSARGRSALIVCTDIARYPLGSPGEPTQGAGAVAMIVSERPRLLELEVGRSGCYARDVHDFWRPLDHKDALTDGHFSVQCYLDALEGAYRDWQRTGGREGGELVRTCYHVPYGKMARKAHRHRKMLDGASEEAAEASFATEVEPSLRIPAQVGNIYTGSLYLALASLLHHDGSAVAGQRIGLFSYGSGCAAEFFAGRVHPDAAPYIQRLRLDEPLSGRQRLTVADYEALRRGDEQADRRPAPAGMLASGVPGRLPLPGAVSLTAAQRTIFCGIDAGERRVYQTI